MSDPTSSANRARRWRRLSTPRATRGESTRRIRAVDGAEGNRKESCGRRGSMWACERCTDAETSRAKRFEGASACVAPAVLAKRRDQDKTRTSQASSVRVASRFSSNSCCIPHPLRHVFCTSSLPRFASNTNPIPPDQIATNKRKVQVGLHQTTSKQGMCALEDGYVAGCCSAKRMHDRTGYQRWNNRKTDQKV